MQSGVTRALKGGLALAHIKLITQNYKILLFHHFFFAPSNYSIIAQKREGVNIYSRPVSLEVLDRNLMQLQKTLKVSQSIKENKKMIVRVINFMKVKCVLAAILQ